MISYLEFQSSTMTVGITLLAGLGCLELLRTMQTCSSASLIQVRADQNSFGFRRQIFGPLQGVPIHGRRISCRSSQWALPILAWKLSVVRELCHWQCIVWTNQSKCDYVRHLSMYFENPRLNSLARACRCRHLIGGRFDEALLDTWRMPKGDDDVSPR